ncbi:S1 family peptidase [Roseovarius sp. TE539]|uniref:trypsin-like serine peptidase n=1 Tax=Roseovarius sp. TE539 TaxID=2249812 RepID=UPI000DDCBDD1|nr:trypsin-like serine protease [Roseovarius sp. TE539]RBI76095.1 S1 family peptidase [Roseovarius sp. TE539]
MRRVFLFLVAVLTVASPVAADGSGLRRLNTGDENRGWEAVGRLDLDGRELCTGALIEPDLVLTAAHCLFDRTTKQRVDPARIEFLAGWRNGRASAYRWIRRAVVHPDYEFSHNIIADRVRNDVALLELHHPIRNTRVRPFPTDQRPREGQRIGIVSYGKGRYEAPSLEEMCDVMTQHRGVLVMSCDVDFGSSGAPIFTFETGRPRVVSVVSGMAEVDGRKVSLGTQLEKPLQILKAQLASGQGVFQAPPPKTSGVGERRDIGAKFAKP